MSRAMIVISGEDDRERVARWAGLAPDGTRVEFKTAKRTLPQNDRMWAMLTDIATQKEHCGRRYTADQWKVIFLHACGQEVQFIPSLDGVTFIPWGQSSSDLGKDEMSQLIEFMFAWGAENNVHFNEPPEQAPACADAGAATGTASAASSNSSRETQPPSPEPGTKPAPEGTDATASVGAGTSQSSAAPLGETAGAEGGPQATEPGDSALHGSAGLPEGLRPDWKTAYAQALGRVQKIGALSRVAAEFWKPYGYEKIKASEHAEAERAIYRAFVDHFGAANAEKRNAVLKELGAT